MLLTLALPALGQEQAPQRIQSIEVRGLLRTERSFVLDVLGTKVGDPADRASLDDAVQRLLRTGRFLSVRYELEQRDDGVAVVLQVSERINISAVRFKGNAKFRDTKLADQVGIKIGDPVDLFAIRGGVDTISAMYREAGYNDAVVTFDRALVQRSGELVYRVEEGVQIRVRKILFEGNESYKPRKLRRQIDSKTALGIFRTGEFDEERAESDAAALQRFYRDGGYLDARVSYRRELSDDGRNLTLVFTIVEGTRYSVESIEWRGNDALPADEFIPDMETKVGEPYQQLRLDRDVRAIQSKYWALGYLYSSVRSSRTFSDTPGLVKVLVEVQEQGQYRVGKVVVRGNARTKDKVARRALNLYPPDDLFDLNEAREAEKRLTQTQIFESARVIPVGDAPDRRDVVIDVQEAERAGPVIFGIGVTSNSGVVGTVVLDLKNFDIADRPRNWTEFFKFRSFFGAGQRMRLELQPGTEVSRFRIDFTEPYFMDKPIRFDSSFYVFNRGRDAYDETRVGAVVSFGKRLERGLLAGWSGEIALRIESVDVDDVDFFAADDILDVEGSNTLTSLKFSLVRDRTDSRFLPTQGDRLRLSWEQYGILGGDDFFAKLIVSYTWYKTLAVDRLDRKGVLRLHAEGGAIVGNAPVFERFYAGGIGSVRGFQFRGIGERDGFDDDNIGGESLLILGAEYAFPLFGENVRGHVFLDTGTAGSGTYRASIGVGVRMTLDLFGPIPIEFNLAAPVSSDADDDEQVFSFLIGSLF